MAAWLNACRFTPTLGGTTDWTYSAAVTGYNSPALAGVVNGRPYKYRAEDATNTQWEEGEGTYNTSTGVLSRTTVLQNSAGTGTAAGQSGAGAKIPFSTVPQVAIVALKEDLLSIEEANAFTATQQQQARVNLYAAPFDAVAYNGMQINGGVDISQELGTTGVATLTTGGTYRYIADNWEVSYWNVSATAMASAQIAAASFPAALPGYNFALQAKATAAFTPANGDSLNFRHRVEGNRVVRLGWGTASAQPIAIAFQFYSTVSGVAFIRASNSANNRAYYIEFTVAAGWQWVTLTIPGDTTGTWVKDTGIGLFVDIFAAGKQASPVTPGAWGTSTSVQTTNSTNLLGTINNVVALTGFLLLPGLELPNSARAPLIMRPADQELILCKRHLYVLAPGVTGANAGAGGIATGGTTGYYPIGWDEMRATPTSVTMSAPGDWSNNPFSSPGTQQSGTSVAFAGTNRFGTRVQLTSAATSAPSGAMGALETLNTAANIIARAQL